jgi:hypothetical protein
MVKFTKLKVGVLLVGITTLVLIVALVANTATAKCGDGHSRVGLECRYEGDVCSEGETLTTISDVSYCVYGADTLASQGFLWWILGGTVVGSGIIFVLYAVLKNADRGEGFSRKDVISPIDAVEAFALAWSHRYSIPVINGKHKRGAFRFFGGGFPSTKYKERFYKFQTEIMEGSYTGIFTVITSLNKGVHSILNWDFTFEETNLKEFRVEREWPIATPEDPTEQRLERLFEVNPEKATQLQEEILESNIKRQSGPQQVVEGDEQQEGLVPSQPVRPYNRRYYPYRRYRR